MTIIIASKQETKRTGILSWSKDIGDEDFIPYTIADRKAARRNAMQKSLWFIREYGQDIGWKPCIIWTFHNKQDFPFAGWYCVIRTLKKEWYLNWKRNLGMDYDKLSIKLMQLYPYVLPLLENFKLWMKEFMKHHKTSFRQRDEGMALAWCYIDSRNYIIDIELKKGNFI